jgi:hypothetical protein
MLRIVSKLKSLGKRGSLREEKHFSKGFFLPQNFLLSNIAKSWGIAGDME